MSHDLMDSVPTGVLRDTPREPCLNDRLMALMRYGAPKLICSSATNKWWAYIEMHVAAKGASFKIESEFKSSPNEAMTQLEERIVSTLEKLR